VFSIYSLFLGPSVRKTQLDFEVHYRPRLSALQLAASRVTDLQLTAAPLSSGSRRDRDWLSDVAREFQGWGHLQRLAVSPSLFSNETTASIGALRGLKNLTLLPRDFVHDPIQPGPFSASCFCSVEVLVSKVRGQDLVHILQQSGILTMLLSFTWHIEQVEQNAWHIEQVEHNMSLDQIFYTLRDRAHTLRQLHIIVAPISNSFTFPFAGSVSRLDCLTSLSLSELEISGVIMPEYFLQMLLTSWPCLERLNVPGFQGPFMALAEISRTHPDLRFLQLGVSDRALSSLLELPTVVERSSTCIHSAEVRLTMFLPADEGDCLAAKRLAK
jgi:hypothetical protein